MKTLREYIGEERGRAAKLATAAGTSLATITRIADGEQNASADLLLKIEAASGGEVTAAEMIRAIGVGRGIVLPDGPNPVVGEAAE